MRIKLALGVAALTAFSPMTALATNGYFSHGYGTISKGMAGAGTALSQDSIAAATNPAGMAFVGNRIDGGFEVFSPRREYTVEGPVSPPPAFSLQPGTYKSSRTGVNLEQLFIAPTWSWEFSDNQAFGISPVIAYQRFEAEGLQSFAPFSSDPGALSNNGTDDAWGYGYQIGWQGEITDTLRGGLSWRNILKMNEFDKYRGLFAEQGDFDIRQMFNAGIAWSGLENHWFLLDIQHIRYSEINSVGNPLLPNLQTAQLGDDNGAGFGWDDMTIVKLGWQWQQTPAHAWRAGVSYGENPISDEDVLFNILAPGVQEWHLTGGFTHSFTENLDVSGMAFYSPAKTVTGPNPLAPNQTIDLEMYQLGASVSVGWKY